MMQPKFSIFFITIATLMLFSCGSKNESTNLTYSLVDKNATESTQKLYEQLIKIAANGFAIGHQDDTSYGLGWRFKKNDSIKSDVQIVTNDFPAVFGFDLGHLELGASENLDSVPFDDMKYLIIDAYKKGGIITISWHLNNPVSNGSAWDKTPAVSQILKNGLKRKKYEIWIQKLASFIKSLKYNNQPIPIIFRPFHEMNGSWFWWGAKNCSSEDYKMLWKETVELLRDTHQIHNLLYAYSPNMLNPEDKYLDFYPGDDFADILGIDIYDFNNSENYSKAVQSNLKILKTIAHKKNKVYAFTETGLESLKTAQWFTKVLYPVIENSGISWVLTWRNHDKKHHYMPYKGQLNEADFKQFENLPKTLFLKDINILNTY